MPSFPENRQKSLADFIGKNKNLPVGRFFTVDLEAVESYPTVCIDSISNADDWVARTPKEKRDMPLIYTGPSEPPKGINIPKKIEHKFYVGSLSIFNGANNYAKKTLAEAVEQATELAQRTEQD